MPVPIKVNSIDVVITPFFDMQHKEMLHSYRKGIRYQIQNESGLRSIRELVYFLQKASCTNLFDREPIADIYQFVGYEFGFIHGGILTHEWTLRPDVTILVAFDDSQDAIRGYKAGRQWFFDEAAPDERRSQTRPREPGTGSSTVISGNLAGGVGNATRRHGQISCSASLV